MSVTLNTSLGPLKLELRPDLAPAACFNFLALCAKGSYNNTIFHRSVRQQFIQGGDVDTKTGRTGFSIFHDNPKPCFSNALSHSSRGTVSMTISPENSDSSQFFITFSSQPELDGQFTVIGHVIAGMDVLDKMEGVQVDSRFRPLTDISVISTIIHSNPFAKGLLSL
ncbi:hypothetical protein RCL1_003948 [Eukaryota sp. TZLM3-RCL]